MAKTPTKRAYDGLEATYYHFNKQLFRSRLPPYLITVRPHRGAYGYFSGERFGSRDGKEIHDEIALNIKTFQQRSPHEILSTLVHEMVHLEQFHFGAPSRNGYHNKQWAMWMERIGLMPSDSGAPGGKRTGQRLHHYVIPDGPFAVAVAKRKFAVPYFDRAAESNATRGKRKLAYTCPSCEDKVSLTAKRAEISNRWPIDSMMRSMKFAPRWRRRAKSLIATRPSKRPSPSSAILILCSTKGWRIGAQNPAGSIRFVV
jgi:predicted SprT family Zn-dependent metalloprotease